MNLPVGTQVRVKFGPTTPERIGVVTRSNQKNSGYRVKLDPPKTNQFEPDVVRVYGRDLTPVEPRLHARWEAEWAKAPFVDRTWTQSKRSR